ncbi:unnamed protein product [Bemisia tabaci]|uniref:Uncharacterized protein n=1 Tax=Bemisia tabaci TaxID=7038 RepID=A0A9P0F5D8_BEMTA|nr:unnamed protein product [Bemisia tabaci]
MTTGLRHITSEPANLQLKPLTSGMEKKKSPQLKQKMRSVVGTASDSEGDFRKRLGTFSPEANKFYGSPGRRDVDEPNFIGSKRVVNVSSCRYPDFTPSPAVCV